MQLLCIVASLHKQAGRAFWFASYRDASGKQHFVSTKIRHTPSGQDGKERATNSAKNRRLALDVAMRLEEAERGNATEIHLRKLLSDVSERVNQRRLEFKSTDTFLNDWLARAEKTKSAGTHERYRGIVKNFLTSLGSRAKAKLSDITIQDLQKFIEYRLEGGRNPSTVRTDCKILNAPFALALRQGLCLSNPVAGAEIPEGTKESRSPFSREQVGDLLKACDRLAEVKGEDSRVWKEWKTCIMIGFYTGVRLGDAVGMRFSAFNFEERVLKVRPQKTSRKKRDLFIPLHPQLEAHLLDTPIPTKEGSLKSDPEEANNVPICPTLAQRMVGGKHGLSLQFHEVMAKAGIKQETIEAGGTAGRDLNKFTFRSVRHSFISEMANAGIAPDVRQLLAGHSSESSHAVYTHTKIDALRQAIAKLPLLK